MRKMSITALRAVEETNPLEESNEKEDWKMRLHLCFQISGLNFSSYRKSLNQFIINISEPVIFAAFR